MLRKFDNRIRGAYFEHLMHEIGIFSDEAFVEQMVETGLLAESNIPDAKRVGDWRRTGLPSRNSPKEQQRLRAAIAVLNVNLRSPDYRILIGASLPNNDFLEGRGLSTHETRIERMASVAVGEKSEIESGSCSSNISLKSFLDITDIINHYKGSSRYPSEITRLKSEINSMISKNGFLDQYISELRDGYSEFEEVKEALLRLRNLSYLLRIKILNEKNENMNIEMKDIGAPEAAVRINTMAICMAWRDLSNLECYNRSYKDKLPIISETLIQIIEKGSGTSCDLAAFCLAYIFKADNVYDIQFSLSDSQIECLIQVVLKTDSQITISNLCLIISKSYTKISSRVDYVMEWARVADCVIPRSRMNRKFPFDNIMKSKEVFDKIEEFEFSNNEWPNVALSMARCGMKSEKIMLGLFEAVRSNKFDYVARSEVLFWMIMHYGGNPKFGLLIAEYSKSSGFIHSNLALALIAFAEEGWLLESLSEESIRAGLGERAIIHSIITARRDRAYSWTIKVILREKRYAWLSILTFMKFVCREFLYEFGWSYPDTRIIK